uniref:Uncharacterized protein n=1 Tax=Anguilla anguilla TaxID=7936 RepID=A0A0E9SN86_ANGAN
MAPRYVQTPKFCTPSALELNPNSEKCSTNLSRNLNLIIVCPLKFLPQTAILACFKLPHQPSSVPLHRKAFMSLPF